MHARTHAHAPPTAQQTQTHNTHTHTHTHAHAHTHTHRQSTANFVEMPPSNMHRTAQGGKPEHGWDQAANITKRSTGALISVYNSMTREIYDMQNECDLLLDNVQALRSDTTPC